MGRTSLREYKLSPLHMRGSFQQTSGKMTDQQQHFHTWLQKGYSQEGDCLQVLVVGASLNLIIRALEELIYCCPAPFLSTIRLQKGKLFHHLQTKKVIQPTLIHISSHAKWKDILKHQDNESGCGRILIFQLEDSDRFFIRIISDHRFMDGSSIPILCSKFNTILHDIDTGQRYEAQPNLTFFQSTTSEMHDSRRDIDESTRTILSDHLKHGIQPQGQGGNQYWKISESLNKRSIKKKCRSLRCHPSTFFHACFRLACHQYFETSHLMIVSPFKNRNATNVNAVGCLFKDAIIADTLNKQMTGEAFLQHVLNISEEAFYTKSSITDLDRLILDTFPDLNEVPLELLFNYIPFTNDGSILIKTKDQTSEDRVTKMFHDLSSNQSKGSKSIQTEYYYPFLESHADLDLTVVERPDDFDISLSSQEPALSEDGFQKLKSLTWSIIKSFDANTSQKTVDAIMFSAKAFKTHPTTDK